MSRTELSSRRPSITRAVRYDQANGNSATLQVTVGFFDEAMTRPAEIFCADFKAGSEFHLLVMDKCILISRLLQHGDEARTIGRSLAHPLSLTLLRAIEEVHK